MDPKELLKNMIEIPSPSGYEDTLMKYLYRRYRLDFKDFEVSAHGALTAFYKKDAPFKVMLAGHADEISYVVAGYNDNGTLQVCKNGGVFERLYVGCKVKIISDRGTIYGVMGTGKKLLEEEKIDSDDLFVDIGCFNRQEAQSIAPIGAYVIHDTDMVELANGLLAGRAFDDRVGVYIIFEAASRAASKGAKVGIMATATVGEETNGRGATNVGNAYKPDVCVTVDVTWATDYPDSGHSGNVALDKGGVICRGSVPNRRLVKLLEECAHDIGTRVQYEASPGLTWTDADDLMDTAAAPQQLLFSVPLRYMHSPVEVLSVRDVESMIDVLTEFLVRIDENYSLAPYELTD